MNTPLRNACRRFTEEVCGQAIICGCLWLIASVTMLPVGIGLYAGYDKHIGTILMSVGGVCLFTIVVYAMAVKFHQYYREEVAQEKIRIQMRPLPPPQRPADPAGVQVAVAVAQQPTV